MSQRYTGAISTAATVNLASSGAHTFCGWVYANSTASAADVLYGDNNGGLGVPDSAWLGFDGTDWVFQETVTGSGTYYFASPRTLNVWTHLALVYDGATVYSYVNGVLVDSAAWNSNGRTAFNYMDVGYGGDFTLQDVMAFPVALTAAQIQQAMRTLAPPTGVAPYAWYQMTNAAPTTDASGNGHTLSGGGDANGTQRLFSGTGAANVSGAASATSASTLAASGSTQVTGAANVAVPPTAGSQRFTGTVRNAASVSLASSSAHTFLGWIYAVDTSTPGDLLYGDIAHNTAYTDSAWVGFHNANWIFQETVTGSSTYQFTTPRTLNVWTHLALTYDGATARSYVNGVLVDSAAWNSNGRALFNHLDIGFGGNFVAQDVMCFSAALSASQIQEAMRLAQPAGVSAYAWWRLANAAPTTDATGNGHTLSGPGNSDSLLAVIAGGGLTQVSSAASIAEVTAVTASCAALTRGRAFASGSVITSTASGASATRRSTTSRRIMAVLGRRPVRL